MDMQNTVIGIIGIGLLLVAFLGYWASESKVQGHIIVLIAFIMWVVMSMAITDIIKTSEIKHWEAKKDLETKISRSIVDLEVLKKKIEKDQEVLPSSTKAKKANRDEERLILIDGDIIESQKEMDRKERKEVEEAKVVLLGKWKSLVSWAKETNRLAEASAKQK